MNIQKQDLIKQIKRLQYEKSESIKYHKNKIEELTLKNKRLRNDKKKLLNEIKELSSELIAFKYIINCMHFCFLEDKRSTAVELNLFKEIIFNPRLHQIPEVFRKMIKDIINLLLKKDVKE